MDLFELFQIFSMASQKIDALWEFFVTVHLAIFAGLFIFHKMKAHQLVITLISYVFFSLINLRAKIQEYELYESFLLEIKKNNNENLVHVNAFISQYDIDDRIIIIYMIHILAFIFFSYLLKRSLSSDNLNG